MKAYIRPTFECIELRVEERLAGSICITNGSCDDAMARAALSAGISFL